MHMADLPPCWLAPCRYTAITCLQERRCIAAMTNGSHVTLAHCSVGCNQLAECLDWGAQGLIAYGAHNQAVIYDSEVPTTSQVRSTCQMNASPAQHRRELSVYLHAGRRHPCCSDRPRCPSQLRAVAAHHR